MKISTKVEFGIIALIDIAVNAQNGNVVKVNAISQRNNISAKYLEQIIPLLRQAKFLTSVKGAGGGYVLARDPAEINMNEIVNALDNTVLSASDFSDRLEPAAAAAVSECLWEPVTDYLQSFSKGVTLKTLADRYNEIQNKKSELMYYI